MLKSEYAIQQVRKRLTGAGPIKVDTLIAEVWGYTDDGDPRWIGVALMRLREAGQIEYPTCDHNHDHGDGCTVQMVAV